MVEPGLDLVYLPPNTMILSYSAKSTESPQKHLLGTRLVERLWTRSLDTVTANA